MNLKRIVIVFICISYLNILLVAQPVKVIFDTDMESDVDYVGALAMLHCLADEGDAEILATMVCSLNPWSVSMTDVINTFCGRPDIPIGAVKTLGVYRNSAYAKIVSEEFSHDISLGENSPDAVYVYRKVLSEQPDSSVIIVTVGYLTNLMYLLQSLPDEVSPLNGKELVKQKVKHLVCIGGRYPLEQDIGKWGNFKPDPYAIRTVAAECPTRIIFTGGGVFADDISTGEVTFNYPPGSNPISRAYSIFLKRWNRQWHHSADLIAVYIAVKGYEDFFELNTEGYNHIFENGTMVWRLQPNDSRHEYVSSFKEGINPKDVTKIFDQLLAKPIVGQK